MFEKPFKMTISKELPAATPDLHRLRIKAKNEIGEKDELIPQKIEEIRELLAADNTVNLPPKNFDNFFLRCLRARKYDIERAAKTYKKLCQLHLNHEDITDHITPSACENLLRDTFVGILKNRDEKGRQILFIQVRKWDAYKYTLDQALASLFLCLHEITESVDTQLNGIVVLVDIKGFGFSHARQASPSKIQAIVNIVQDSYPARFKEFHFLNHPSIFNMVFAVAKPFLKDKIRKRIFFHGHDVSSVHKNINPAILPERLNGLLPDNESFDDEALSRLLDQEEYFLSMKQNFVVLKDRSEYAE